MNLNVPYYGAYSFQDEHQRQLHAALYQMFKAKPAGYVMSQPRPNLLNIVQPPVTEPTPSEEEPIVSDEPVPNEPVDTIEDPIEQLPADQEVTFKIVDSKTSNIVQISRVLVNGEEVDFTQSNGFVTCTVPASSSFMLGLEAEGYVSFSESMTTENLNRSSQPLTKTQTTVDEYEAKVVWNHVKAKDLDTHLLVFNASNEKLSEVYYSKKKWSDANTSIILDKDDVGQDDGETLTISSVCKDYKYVFVMFDYTNRSRPSSTSISDSDAKVVMTVNNETTSIESPDDQSGIFWTVYEIVNGEVNVINMISAENTQSIKA